MTARSSFPLLALVGATRAMAGVGLGFLLAERFARRRRRRIGTLLFGVGAASTLPLMFAVIRQGRRRRAEPASASPSRFRVHGTETEATRYASRGPS